MTDDQMQAYNAALSGENIFVTGGAVHRRMQRLY